MAHGKQDHSVFTEMSALIRQFCDNTADKGLSLMASEYLKRNSSVTQKQILFQKLQTFSPTLDQFLKWDELPNLTDVNPNKTFHLW